MFVYNLKLNGKSIFKVFFTIVFILVIILTIIAITRIFTGMGNSRIKDKVTAPEIANILPSNYTNILKMVHDNIDEYINQKITFEGYIYRVYDFKDSQFVLARDMLISSDFQTLVVGFLCDFKDAKSFNEGTWVKITGKITKGDYHGEIPIIKIEEITQIQKPTDEYVYPPDDNFIPTSVIL